MSAHQVKRSLTTDFSSEQYELQLIWAFQTEITPRGLIDLSV
jgi:hypothetical protein